MPALPKDPYGEFRFLVGFDDGPGQGQPSEILGGFSDVTGLGGGTDPVNYRNGGDAVKHVRKIPGTRKFGTVTLRRGVVGDPGFSRWIKAALDGDAPPRRLRLRMLDDARDPVATFTLHNARPTGCVGAAVKKTGKGVEAVEALSFAHEGIERT